MVQSRCKKFILLVETLYTFRGIKGEMGVLIKRGQVRRTNKTGESTIEKILSAAQVVLVRDGIEKFTVDRIAREAGTTKGTFLYHFHDKERLLEVLMVRYVEHLQSMLSSAVDRVRASGRHVPSELETVAGFIDWYRHFRKQKPEYSALGVRLLSLSASNRSLREPILQWYRRLFVTLRGAGSSDVVAGVLMLEGLFYLRHLQLDMTTDEEIENILRRLEERLGLLEKHA